MTIPGKKWQDKISQIQRNSVDPSRKVDDLPQDAKTNNPKSIMTKKQKNPIFILILFVVFSGVLLYLYFFVYLSPERILLRMYKKIFELQTFDFSSDFNMTYSQKVTQTDYFSSNYKATIVGVADIGQLNYPKASTAIEIFSEKASLGKIETMAFGNTFYIKIHDSLASQILGFEKFSEHWIKVEANTFDAYYGGFLFENMSITNEEKAQIYEIVKKNPPITVLQKLPDDNMEGKKVYHFKVKLSKENLINILAGFVDSAQDGKSKSDTKEKLKKIISHVELDEADLWIGKKDLYPYKFKFRFLLLNNQSPDLHVTSDATITLNKFNEYKNITAPGVSLPPQEVIDWINSHFEFPEKPL